MGTLAGTEPSLALRAARVLLIAAGLAAWFWTQRMLARRAWPAGRIATAFTSGPRPSTATCAHPAAANRLLIASSAIIDALGLLLLGGRCSDRACGRSWLLLLFLLRQVCRRLTAPGCARDDLA
jgi:hypothetical protein